MAAGTSEDSLTAAGAKITSREETMSEDRRSQDSPGAEDAALASAGEPHSEEAEEPREEIRSPTPEELDAREENFARPRKPMGPTQDAAETIPEEP